MTWNPQSIQTLFLTTVPAPRCTSQRLPHLLRLLLMYQANPIRASPSRFFSTKSYMPQRYHILTVFSDSGDFVRSRRFRRLLPFLAPQARGPRRALRVAEWRAAGSLSPRSGRLAIARRFNGGKRNRKIDSSLRRRPARSASGAR
jgi:hypothetical protein